MSACASESTSSSAGAGQCAGRSKDSSTPTPIDSFYGYKTVSLQAGRYIVSLFACPEYSSPRTATSPRLGLAHFIAYSLYRARLPHEVALSALLLLSRLKAKFPAAKGSSGHRLWLAAFMMASKCMCDDTYSNRSWAVCGQNMFKLNEINQMEREMLGYLSWQVNCRQEELIFLQNILESDFSAPFAIIPSASSANSFHTAQASSSASSTHRVAVPYPSPPPSPIPVPTKVTIAIPYSHGPSHVDVTDNSPITSVSSPSNSSLSSSSSMGPSTPLDGPSVNLACKSAAHDPQSSNHHYYHRHDRYEGSSDNDHCMDDSNSISVA